MFLTIYEKENALRDALRSVEGLGGGSGSDFHRDVSRHTFNGRKPELRRWVVERFSPAKELVGEDDKFPVEE